MPWNKLDETSLPENQLLLYVSDQLPGEAWQQFADGHRWEITHQRELLAALGAFVMLMPGIVVIERRSDVGSAVLYHIESILPTTPQPMLILIELGVPDCVAQYGNILRLGAAAGAAPGQILALLSEMRS